MIPYLTKRGPVFVAVFELHGKRCRTSTRTADPAEAAAALAVLAAGGSLAAGSAKGRESSSVPDLITQWGESKVRRGCTPGYVRKGQRIIGRCVRLMRWGSLRSLTPAGMEALREAMLERGASSGTVNTRMRYMGSWCSWLWRTGKISSDPMVDLSPLPHTPRKRRALTLAEVQALLSASPAWAGRVYAALFYSGMRVDIELAALTWQQVGDDGVLRFRGKGGRDRTVPVSDALRGILEAQRTSQAMQLIVGGLVFPKVPTSAEFARHLKLAGIHKADARGHVATRHSLRHSWNQELTRAGVNSEQRQHLGGWSDSTMPTGQYQDASALDLREAMNRLPRIA